MNVAIWLFIGLIVLMLLALTIIVFLEAIDAINEETGQIIFVCVTVPPIALVLLIAYGYTLLYDLCEKHKDKIRKFLKIK